MDPNAAATQPVQQANGQVPPPPSGGTPVSNPNYQASATTSATPSTPPPPPGGGQPVPNPNYVAPTLSASDDSIPAFIRDGVDVSKVRQRIEAPPDKTTTAEVKDVSPMEVDVYNPEKYNADTGPRNHELTHTYQDTRSSDLPAAKQAKVDAGGSPLRTLDDDEYDYSGRPTTADALPYEQQMQAKLEGLKKARNSGKSVGDFNVEQQAEMVRDYKKQHDAFLNKVKTGKATKKDLQAMSDLQNTYHPFMEQLAKMPSKGTKINPGYLNLLLGRNMPTINTHPDAPGLPSFATAGIGVVKADPLMGGKSQAIHRKKESK